MKHIFLIDVSLVRGKRARHITHTEDGYLRVGEASVLPRTLDHLSPPERTVLVADFGHTSNTHLRSGWRIKGFSARQILADIVIAILRDTELVCEAMLAEAERNLLRVISGTRFAFVACRRTDERSIFF